MTIETVYDFTHLHNIFLMIHNLFIKLMDQHWNDRCRPNDSLLHILWKRHEISIFDVRIFANGRHLQVKKQLTKRIFFGKMLKSNLFPYVIKNLNSTILFLMGRFSIVCLESYKAALTLFSTIHIFQFIVSSEVDRWCDLFRIRGKI